MANLLFNLPVRNLRFFSRREGLFGNRIILANAILTTLFIIILLLLILFKIKPSSEVSALHYNVLIGIDVVQSGWWLLSMPGLAAIFAVVNFYFVKRFFKFEPVASYYFAIASTLVSGIFLIAAIALSKIN